MPVILASDWYGSSDPLEFERCFICNTPRSDVVTVRVSDMLIELCADCCMALNKAHQYASERAKRMRLAGETDEADVYGIEWKNHRERS